MNFVQATTKSPSASAATSTSPIWNARRRISRASNSVNCSLTRITEPVGAPAASDSRTYASVESIRSPSKSGSLCPHG
jgi:hypothetical protein